MNKFEKIVLKFCQLLGVLMIIGWFAGFGLVFYKLFEEQQWAGFIFMLFVFPFGTFTIYHVLYRQDKKLPRY